MYKVFYNEKAIILTDKPVEKYKSLKYVTNNQFDEALDMLKNSNNEVINIYHHNLSKLWNNFQNHFKYLEAAGDRKSTRLNSSHVANSYAVFCLKNKNL